MRNEKFKKTEKTKIVESAFTVEKRRKP